MGVTNLPQNGTGMECWLPNDLMGIQFFQAEVFLVDKTKNQMNIVAWS